MHKLIIASAAAALMIGASATAFAQTSAADCQTKFQTADVNKDGSLQTEEAKIFIEAMNKAEVKPADASLVTQEEFMKACEKDAFANIDPATMGATGQAAATADQPASTTGQAATATADQPASTTDQSATATTEQPATTTDQSATATTEQPAAETTTDQTAATQPTTTEQTATESSEQALAAPSGLLASNLIGTTVYTPDDQSVGDINDIILSTEGQPTQVVVGVGGFLGLGEKDVLMDMSKLKVSTTDDGNVKVVVETTQEELQNLPAFTKNKTEQTQDGQQQQ
ncbi:MAG TPA: PRC-barrel domain-containing protein [Aestuariivirgaceae bacterium]|jgi:hypothetical protein